MSWQIESGDEGLIRAILSSVRKGAWTHSSVASTPPEFTPVFTNWDLPGGIPTTMYGDADFIATAWTSGWGTTLNGAFIYRVAGSDPTLIIATTGGYVGRWTGAAWAELRNSLTTTATDWWSGRQFGTDLFITNRTDGIYRWDGDTLVPIGAKPIAQMENDEASLWASETADTTNYREGAQSMYVESTGSQTTMTFTPAANFDAVTGRFSAQAYASDKSPGTDFYHFKVMFSNTGTIDTTNTRVLMTDGAAVTLNFPYTVWDSDRAGTTLTNPPVAGTWYDVYLPALDGTDSGTFNAANIDTFAFAVDTSAGTLRMNVDDFYVIYDDAKTMPAVQVLEEWKNMLWGGDGTGAANRDTLYFSKVQAPDEYASTASFPIKAFGEKVTAFKNFYNQLTVGADNHVFTISGSTVGYTYPAYLFDVNEVTDEFGISSHRSVVKAKNRLWWNWQKQFCTYNGTSVEKASYPIDVTIAGIEDDSLFEVVGAPFRRLNQLWWTWPRDGQSANDRLMRYDLETDAWLPCIGITTPLLLQTFVSDQERLLSFTAADRKVKNQADTSSLAFAGTNVAATWELPPLHLQGDTIEQVVVWLQYLTNTGTLTVAYRVADHLRALAAASYTTLESITQSAAGELGRIRIDDRSPWLQLRLTTDGVRSEIQPPIVVDCIRAGRPF